MESESERSAFDTSELGRLDAVETAARIRAGDLKPEEVIREGSTWRANCPKGHRIDDGIFARVLLGWACSECEQVYPASECKLRVRE